MSENAKRKTVRSTAKQINMLVDYMACHNYFAAGEFSGPLGPKQHEKQWAQLQRMLSEIGPHKSVEQWKHTWRDLRKRARIESASIKKTQSKTGNSTYVPNLSSKSKKILDTLGHESAIGIESEQETGLGSSIDIEIEEVVLETENIVEVPTSAMLPPANTTQTTESESPIQSSMVPRQRRRRRLPLGLPNGAGQSSVSIQFVQLQKENNKLLKISAENQRRIASAVEQQTLSIKRALRRNGGPLKSINF